MSMFSKLTEMTKSLSFVEARAGGAGGAANGICAPEGQPEEFSLFPDDILAHLTFLREAFRGHEACAWQGMRTYIFEVSEGVGAFVVTIDAADGVDPVITPPVVIFPREDEEAGRQRETEEEGQKTSPKKVSFAEASDVSATIACGPADLLTMLAGGAAELTPTSFRAMQEFLAAFDFRADAYAAFCERRHLKPWVAPASTDGAGRGRIGERVAKSLGTLATSAQVAAKEAASSAQVVATSAHAAAKEAAAGVEQRLRAAREKGGVVVPRQEGGGGVGEEGDGEPEGAEGGEGGGGGDTAAAAAGGGSHRLRKLSAGASAGATLASGWLQRASSAATAGISAAAAAVNSSRAAASTAAVAGGGGGGSSRTAAGCEERPVAAAASAPSDDRYKDLFSFLGPAEGSGGVPDVTAPDVDDAPFPTPLSGSDAQDTWVASPPAAAAPVASASAPEALSPADLVLSGEDINLESPAPATPVSPPPAPANLSPVKAPSAEPPAGSTLITSLLEAPAAAMAAPPAPPAAFAPAAAAPAADDHALVGAMLADLSGRDEALEDLELM
jgi:hypothetical protein